MLWMPNVLYGNINLFLLVYSQRLTDMDRQIWSSKCQDSSKLYFYHTLKQAFGFEPYLDYIYKYMYRFKKTLVAFRTSSHERMIEKGWLLKLSREERTCIYRQNVVETEYYFILICPLYTSLRLKYLMKSSM
jgi:hypothetical protein